MIKNVSFAPRPPKLELCPPLEGECPMWHPYKCFTSKEGCVVKPKPSGGKKSGTLNKMMDMAIYQAISKKAIVVNNKAPIHPIMPMERIMALINAGVNAAFKRQTGEDIMTAALLNQRMDIVKELQEVHGLSITADHVKYVFAYFKANEKRVSESESRVSELERLLKEEVAKKAELEDILKDYRDIEEGLPENASSEKLKKMLAHAIKQTELSYQRVKDMEATMHEMFESAHRKKRTRHS